MSITSRINEMSSHIEQAYDELQGLGADLTNVNKNIENISMVLDDIYDSMPQVSGEGTSLTLDDTRVGKIKSTLKGNTSQTGTPTPTTPIPINVVSGDNEINVCGKNIWGSEEHGSINEQTGVDAYNENRWRTKGYIDVTPNTQYTLSSDANSNIYYIFYYYDNTKAFISSQPIIGKESATGTTPNNCYYMRCVIADTASIKTTQRQLEKNSTQTTYEPYQGNTYNIDLPVVNLFDKDNANYVNGWIDGTTMRLNTINGNRMFYIPCKPSTTYTISRSVITSSFRTTTYDSTPFPTVTGSNVDYTVGSVLRNDSGKTLTITTGANAKYLVVHYGKIEDTNLNETLASIQVEYGSKANTYTPYGTTPIELCKIGNYQDYFAKSDGRNLFDKDSVDVGKVYSSTGSYDDSGAWNTSDWITVEPNSQYTRTSKTTGTTNTLVSEFDENKTFIQRTNNTSFTHNISTGSTTKFIRISYRNDIGMYDIQFEKGSKATNPQPYGVGKWYLHKETKERILNGGETYSVAATPSGRTVFLLNDQRSETYHSNSIVVIISTHLEGISDNQGNVLNSIRANNSGQIFITTSSDYPDVATFKTFLSANNITFYYILATPTNTEITYQPLIDQLNLLEKAQSKENQTNISQVNNDLPFIISASALKEWQESASLNSTLSMVNPLSLGNTLNTQENNTQPIEVDNIEPLEEEENE